MTHHSLTGNNILAFFLAATQREREKEGAAAASAAVVLAALLYIHRYTSIYIYIYIFDNIALFSLASKKEEDKRLLFGKFTKRAI